MTRSNDATARLRDDPESLRLAIASAADAIATIDLEGRVVSANLALAELTGYSHEELVGMNGYDLLPPEEERAARTRLVDRIASRATQLVKESEIVLKDGRRVPVEVSSTLITRAGEPLGLLAIIRDITRRKQAEAGYRASEERFRGLVESAPDAIVIVDEHGQIELVNRRGEEMFGYSRSELIGEPVETLVPARYRTAHATHRATFFASPHARPMGAGLELFGLRKDSSEFPVEISLGPLNTNDGTLVGVAVRDVSERKQAARRAEELERQLLQAQKLEAIGKLAGGIAHDFNNHLTAIRGYSDLLIARLAQDDPLRRYAEEILRATDAATKLPKQLLAFGRKQPLDVIEVDLNDTVRETCELLRPLLGENIELDMHLGRPAFVMVDPVSLEQALLNLALNARDAMPDGGQLTIATRTAHVDSELASQHNDVAPGDYLVIAVIDTGHGIEVENQHRVFEPFFTTKPAGQGTGLGLASVYGIARQNGGFVTLESTPGQGATFEIHLPQARDPEGASSRRAGSRGTILVVEDEPGVRRLAREVIELDGYETLEAASGADALAALEHHRRPIDAMVTDIKMPGIDGLELTRRLRQHQPGLPVITMSAYAERSLGDEDVFFIAKPFTARQLSEAIEEALRRSGRQPATPPAYEPPARIRVVLADDHPAVLDSVGRALSTAEFDLVGTATDGDAALRAIAERRPDVALVDVRMGGLSGVEVARQAAAVAPTTAVVLYTGFDDDLLKQSLDAGARGFLLKGGPLEQIAGALRQVAAGEIYIDPEVADQLATPEGMATLASLSPREREVLSLLAQGKTNDGAACALSISPETVQSHVRKAMAKLHADTRTAAVATALRLALIN